MALLPKDKGLLPYFLLLDGALSWGSTIGSYIAPLSPAGMKGMYNGPNESQVTPLSIHTFGSWLILSGFIRFYAAYNLSNPGVYACAFCTFVAISWHYLTEWLVFETMGMSAGLVISIIMDCGAVVWMYWQWNAYVKHERTELSGRKDKM
ncbi:Erg28-domain-containing protein [Mollisia scopiformis]|uniref:Erg28-domain-containing protein n=1 Tax=Mollisia scopiformis TaxID=149040 RepID=A0A194XHS2_MOLSC|nr:Erg28-domain-containing protein [Mollisia scopiformis]KUJ19708.1 Erg28-domain-containing protein [Mollisia scopiformis]